MKYETLSEDKNSTIIKYLGWGRQNFPLLEVLHKPKLSCCCDDYLICLAF